VDSCEGLQRFHPYTTLLRSLGSGADQTEKRRNRVRVSPVASFQGSSGQFLMSPLVRQ
jgi:hypothetical protein